MSRFFSAVGASDSESSEEEEIQEPVRRQVVVYSSDEEEVKRIVKPAKEKYLGELKNVIQQINNHKKIKDHTSLLSAFDELVKIYEKARSSVFANDRVPPIFIFCLAELSAFVTASWEDVQGRKSLSKTGFKSLTILRQKLRKFAKIFEDEINNCNNNPDYYTMEEVEEKIDIEEKSVKSDKDSDDMSDFPDNDSDSDSDDDTPYENIRDRFLKKVGASIEDETKKKERKERKKRESKIAEADEEEGWEMVTGSSGGLMDQKLFSKDSDISPSSVLEKMREISKLRRLKRSERLYRLERFGELSKIIDKHDLGAGFQAKIRIAQIMALFEFNPSALEAMKSEHWTKLMNLMNDLIDILQENKIQVDDRFSEEDEQFEAEPIKVKCNLPGMLMRMIEEFHKILKSLDPFKNDFREKFQDDKKIGVIIDKALNFCQQSGKVGDISHVMLCKIENLYYKVDQRVFDENNTEPTSLDVIDKLCKYIYVNDKTQRLRTRAILTQVYHLSLHNKWTSARDLFLMSNLQNGIEYADPATQILYNRTMAQMALCAFRIGNFVEAHNCLSDLITSGRIRELLGQGLTMGRNVERTHEQELRERQFQTPFHMTINLDVIDAAYLMASMLIDVPSLATRENDFRRKPISKHFYLQLKAIDRLNLVGPPESTREHIVAASGALRNAKWRQCLDFLINPKMNKKVWDLILQPSTVHTLLKKEVKKQSLKTYINSYGCVVYETLNIGRLAEMFEMTAFEVETTIAAMILEEDLKASIDGTTDVIHFRKNAAKTALQIVSCQLLEKLSTLVDCNERCCAPDRNTRFANSVGRNQRPQIF